LIKVLEEAKKILDTSAQTNRNLFIAFNSVLATVLILQSFYALAWKFIRQRSCVV
jgi:hypothetical protein